MAPRKNRLSAAELARTDAGAADAPPEPEAAAPAAAPRRKPAKRSTRNVRMAPMPASLSAPLGTLQVRALGQHDYFPHPSKHMSEVGPVAMSNFVCRIGPNRISVRMGAPRSSIPKDVQDLMAESGIAFGIAAPPARKGAVVVEDVAEDFSGPPRARRTSRKRDRDPVERTFAPIRSLPIE